jgi:RNA polymerase sigma-70 factor (ECF subfamily)
VARLEHMTDLELFDAWTRGAKPAAAELFERHFEAVERFFRNKVTEAHDDLVQQTFEACIKSRDRFRKDSSFRTYLFAIAHNVLCSHFRSRRRESHLEFTEVSACDLAPGPSTLFRARREQQLLLEGLRQIPLDYQIILELYYWEGLAGSAIAEIVEMPENTVRSRLRAGRKLLKAKLGELAHDVDELRSMLGDLEQWARSIHGHIEPAIDTTQDTPDDPSTPPPSGPVSSP